jgi:hypothetical protein
VIDRPEKTSAQQFGQFSGIDAVTLTALFQLGIPSGITHHDFADVRLQQVVHQAAQVPSSNVTHKLPRSPCTNWRIVAAFVSTTDSITSLPVESGTAAEIVAW